VKEDINIMPEVWFPNLGIEIQTLPRTALNIFGFEIYWYAVIIAVGVITGLLTAMREARRTGQDPDMYADFFLYVFVACFIGARLYYVVFAWDQYKDNLLKIFNVREGGLAIYGAILAAIPTAIVYTRIKKYDFWKFADTAILGLVIGQVIGRWGNFMNREAFGGYTEGLFALRYLKAQVNFIPQAVLDNILTISGAEYIQVQPTFLYESLWNLGLFIFFNIYKRHKKVEGEIFALYLLGYGIGRFWIEGLRTDQLILFGTGIPVSQALSAVLAVAAVALIILLRRKASLAEKAAE